MAIRNWEFTLADGKHTLRLKHGIGHRRFWIDDVLVLEQRKAINRQVEYPFVVDGKRCIVSIVNTTSVYVYSLFLDGEWIPAKEDKRKGKPPIRNLFVWKMLFWRELQSQPEFQGSGKNITSQSEIHPLFGYFSGYPLLAFYGFAQLGDVAAPAVHIVIRYKLIEKKSDYEKEIKQILGFGGAANKAGLLKVQVEQDFVLFSFMMDTKKLTVEKLTQNIRNIVASLPKYAHSITQHTCEGDTCKMRAGVALKVVLINRYPRWLCDDCIKELTKLGERTLEKYKNIPLNFGRGIFAGFGASILGGVLWALFMVLLDRIAAVMAVLILWMVIWVMDKVGTKRTFLSILIAGIESFCGSILGTYLGVAWWVFQKLGISSKDLFSSWNRILVFLSKVWKLLLDEHSIISSTIWFSLLGVGWLLWILWSKQRAYLKQAFKPDIDVLE